MQQQFTVQISDRSMRRVQIAMAAMQAAEQTARATIAAAQNMSDQARRGLDDALGAICDAHDQRLPDEYQLTVRVDDGLLTIVDKKPRQEVPPGEWLPQMVEPILAPVGQASNGQVDNADNGAAEGIIE